MRRLAYLFTALLTGLVSFGLAFCAEQSDSTSQTPSDQQAKTSHHKLHIKKGSRDDINAIGNRNIVIDQNWYSPAKELEIGKQDVRFVEQNMKFVDDAAVNEYIIRLAQNLVRNSDAKVPFTIKVVDTDEVNGFSLPGGFLYVNSGLILDCENEAELAGVMAHAIAHVAAHHAVRLLTRERIANVLNQPLISATPDPRSDGARLTTGLMFLKFHRLYEEEANYFGIQYLYKAGYDPTAFVARLERDYKRNPAKPGTLSAAFADQPLPVERLTAAKKEIARILPPADHLIVNTPEFDAVKARLAASKTPQPKDAQRLQ
ncbi:MAG TPA: M48 family metalloprotease [Candidatus Angelobacter sp.]